MNVHRIVTCALAALGALMPMAANAQTTVEWKQAPQAGEYSLPTLSVDGKRIAFVHQSGSSDTAPFVIVKVVSLPGGEVLASVDLCTRYGVSEGRSAHCNAQVRSLAFASVGALLLARADVLRKSRFDSVDVVFPVAAEPKVAELKKRGAFCSQSNGALVEILPNPEGPINGTSVKLRRYGVDESTATLKRGKLLQEHQLFPVTNFKGHVEHYECCYPGGSAEGSRVDQLL